MGFDEQGWHVGALAPLPLGEAYFILAPDDDSRMIEARWKQQAQRFFAADLRLLDEKSYPAGARPRRDRATVAIGPRGGDGARVEVATFPLDDAPGLCDAARAASAALGGFDALVARARRIWQVRPEAGDERVALALAAVLASLLLGPILAPDRTVFGVKTARERLAALGW